MKHLIKWLIKIFGSAAINSWCRAMPPNHKTALFTKGISLLSWVSGQEHKRMCSILLGLIIDLLLARGIDLSCLMRAVHALLDFLFLAQLQSYTSETICQLEGSLAAFHANKAIFVDLRVWEHFNISKLHSLMHYISSIQLFGTTDNYNTEQSKHLHIDLMKDAYCATNHKDEYP